MIKIDGSQGEGGGQILRSAVALSAVTGTPVTINNIRAARKKPGLMRQHLTAITAAAEISGAKLSGAEIGSSAITFSPGTIQGGDYKFQVGTAGSTSLVFQTVLPALLQADTESRLSLKGGTHNPFAPPFPFLARAFLPQLARMGAEVTAELVRSGFYPAGGGQIDVQVKPCRSLGPLTLEKRGEFVSRRVRALCANLPATIGNRELKSIKQKLNWTDDCFELVEVKDSPGPGNVLTAEVECENVTEVFCGFGRVGRQSEQVAKDVLKNLQTYLAADDVPVGEYLADQLLLPMAIGAAQGTGGGSYRTIALSRHTTTHIDVVRKFLDVSIDIEKNSKHDVRIAVA